MKSTSSSSIPIKPVFITLKTSSVLMLLLTASINDTTKTAIGDDAIALFLSVKIPIPYS